MPFWTLVIRDWRLAHRHLQQRLRRECADWVNIAERDVNEQELEVFVVVRGSGETVEYQALNIQVAHAANVYKRAQEAVTQSLIISLRGERRGFTAAQRIPQNLGGHLGGLQRVINALAR